MKEFIEESKKMIQKSSNNNKLVLFIGSGVSVNSGLPLWSSLIDEIKEKIKAPKNGVDNLKIAQYYYNSRGEKEYYDFLKERLDIDAIPNKIHDALLELNPSHIITTNYDDLIEKAAIKKSMFYDVVAKDTDLPYTPNNKMIVKMHGDFNNRNIVFKEDDYLSYSNNFKLIENFVKSIFSTKTVIFVGYSLSDVNVKLIFQWIKDILGKDLPKPYFLEINKEEDEIDINEFEYYKNAGINVLYYSEIYKIIKENFEKSENKGERTYNAIEYLISKESKTYNNEYIYDYIDSFKDINIIDRKNFNKFFSFLDLLYMTDYEVIGNTINIHSKKFLEIVNEIKKELEILKQEGNNYKYNEKRNKIINFLNKCGINFIVSTIEGESKNEILYENKELIAYLNIQKDLEEYNFLNIENYIDKTKYLEENITAQNIKKYFENAYALYFFKRYYEAYLEYKKISEFCFRNKNYVLYVLSEFNRYYIGRFVRDSWKVNKDIRTKVKKEIDKIDLNKILYNLPARPQQLEFLNNIVSWNFIQTKFYEMASFKQKIEKDENTIYMGGLGKENSGIYKFQESIRELWNFLKFNMLVIDKYSEVKSIFYNYIDSLLRNYSIPKIIKRKDESFFGMEGENIKTEKITIFDIKLILEFVGQKELEMLFEKHEIDTITIDDNDVNELIKILENTLKYDGIKIIDIDEILLILSKINLSNENYIKVNGLVLIYLHHNLNLNNYKYINKYLYYQTENFKKYDRESLYKILELILNKINENFIKNNHEVLYMIHNLCAYIKTFDSDYKLDISKKIDKIIYFCKMDSQLYTVLIHLYKVISEDEQIKIKDTILEYLNNENFFIIESELYYNAVMKNIIEPDEKHEEKISTFIDEEIASAEKPIKSFPNHTNTLLNLVINLILSDKIKNKKRFEKYTSVQKDFEFLFNLDKFNNQEIDLNWLDDFSDKLLEELSKNENVKKQIRKQVQKIVLDGNNIDKSILKIFMKYFLD